MGRGGEGERFCESREVVGWKRTCEMGEWVGDWFVCGQTNISFGGCFDAEVSVHHSFFHCCKTGDLYIVVKIRSVLPRTWSLCFLFASPVWIFKWSFFFFPPVWKSWGYFTAFTALMHMIVHTVKTVLQPEMHRPFWMNEIRLDVNRSWV